MWLRRLNDFINVYRESFLVGSPPTDHTVVDDFIILKAIAGIGSCVVIIPIAILYAVAMALTAIPMTILSVVCKLFEGKLQRARHDAIINIMHEHAKFVEDKYGYLALTSVRKEDHEYSLEGFITDFLLILNSRHPTIDREGKLQCTIDRRRSVGDIYLLCKHYVKEPFTIIDVIKVLDSMVKNHMVGMFLCTDIKKLVFHKDGQSRQYTIRGVEYNRDLCFQDILDAIKAKKL